MTLLQLCSLCTFLILVFRIGFANLVRTSTETLSSGRTHGILMEIRTGIFNGHRFGPPSDRLSILEVLKWWNLPSSASRRMLARTLRLWQSCIPIGICRLLGEFYYKGTHIYQITNKNKNCTLY